MPMAPSGTDQTKVRAEPIWGLAAILALAVIARTPRLLESLWYDEIAAYIFYSSKGPWYVISNYHDPSNQIFHSLLAWASVEFLGWLGSIEFAFRLPALFFSLLSIVVIRELVREIASERAGWIAALLMAILPVSVLEGADARGYSMMIFFSAAASWLLLRLLCESNPRTCVLYAIACALGVWSHLMTTFVPLGHGVLLLLLCGKRERRRHALQNLAVLLGAAILTLALFAPALDDIFRFYAKGGVVATDGRQPTLLGTEGLHGLLQLGGSWSWCAAVPGLALFASGFIVSIRRQDARWGLAATMLGVPLMVVAVAIVGTWVYARFALFALPGAVLLMALAIDDLWVRRRSLGVAAIGVVAIAAAADLLTRPPRQPLRDAVELVVREQRDSSPVIALGLNVPDIVIYEPREFRILFSAHGGAHFEESLALPQVKHIIISYPHLLSVQRLEAMRAAGFERIAALPGWADWGRGEVWVYGRR